MADIEKAKQALINAHNAGDVEAATKIATYIKSQQSMGQSEPIQTKENPVVEAFDRRMGNVQKLKANNKVDPFVKGLYASGQSIGFAGDLAGQAIGAVTPEFIKEPTLQLVGAAADFVSPVTKPIGEKYGEFKQEHPNIAALAETAGNFSALYPVGKGTQITGKGAEKISAIPAVKSFIKDETSGSLNFKKPPSPSLEGFKNQTASIKERSIAGYRSQRLENAQFSESDITDLRKSLFSLRPKKDLDIRGWKESGELKHVDDILESINTENPDFNSLLNKRNDLNSEINVAERAGNNAKAGRLKAIKKSIDDVMVNDKTGKWQVANHEFAQAATLDDIDYIVQKAMGKAQPANSLDTAINNYLLNSDSRSLSSAERKSLENVTKIKKRDILKKAASSGLTKYATTMAGSSGGIPGAIAGYVVGTYGADFMKDSAMLSKLAKLEDFRNLVLSRKLPDVPTAKPVLRIGDRGQEVRDIERAAARRADVEYRLANGKTGGMPLDPKSGYHVGPPYPEDAPYQYYRPPAEAGQRPPLQLPSPEKMSILAMPEDQISAAIKANNAPFTPPSPSIATPPSRLVELEGKLGRKKYRDLIALSQLLKQGTSPQNQFVKDAVVSFGLTRKQAIELAHEIKQGGDIRPFNETIKVKK